MIPVGQGNLEQKLCVERHDEFDHGKAAAITHSAKSNMEPPGHDSTGDIKFHIEQVLTLDDGSTYTGEVVDSKPHGRGRIKYRVEHIQKLFEGQFQNGMPHGQGVMRYANGSIWEGTYVNGKMEGYGSLTRPDGYSYLGEWGQGKFNGKGKLINEFGDIYEGIFVDGKLNGKGVIKWASGAIYEGECQNNAPHGQGVHTLRNGDVRTGQYRNGVLHGQGTWIKGGIQITGTWENGRLMSGMWGNYPVVNGKRQEIKSSCEIQ
jgi:hypothetical protein